MYTKIMHLCETKTPSNKYYYIKKNIILFLDYSLGAKWNIVK